MKNILTSLTGKEIKTYWDMYNEMQAVEGSYSHCRQTVIGEFILNGTPVSIYKHWSYDGNYTIYPNTELINPIAEVILENWYELKDANGNQMKDENGIYDLCDCVLQFKFNEN